MSTAVYECPNVFPITLNNIGNSALTQIIDLNAVNVGTSCWPNLNKNIEVLLNNTDNITPVACLESLVNFQNLLNFGENDAQVFIVYAGDIDLNVEFNFATDKDLIIMSTCASVTINQALTANNIYVLAPQGTITLGSHANLSVGNGTIMLSAQNGIVYNQSVITANTLVLSHDIDVGASVQNKVVSTSGTLLDDVVCGSGTNVFTLTYAQIVEGGNFGSVTVVSGTNSTITITVTDDIDLELTAEGTESDLVLDQSITIITPGSVCLPQGLVTDSSKLTGTFKIPLNISITAGRHIIAQGSGINTVGTGISGFISLNAGGAIIVSGVGTNPAGIYGNQVSGINSWSQIGNSSSVSVIAGDTITVNSGAVAELSATGINSWSGGSTSSSGSVSVIALYDITITSGRNTGSPSVSGVNSYGGSSSNSILVSACDTISFNNLGTSDSIRATGNKAILISNNISKDNVILGTNLSTLTNTSIAVRLSGSCKFSSISSSNSSNLSEIFQVLFLTLGISASAFLIYFIYRDIN